MNKAKQAERMAHAIIDILNTYKVDPAIALTGLTEALASVYLSLGVDKEKVMQLYTIALPK